MRKISSTDNKTHPLSYDNKILTFTYVRHIKNCVVTLPLVILANTAQITKYFVSEIAGSLLTAFNQSSAYDLISRLTDAVMHCVQ